MILLNSYLLYFICFFQFTSIETFTQTIQNSFKVLRSKENTTALTGVILKYCFENDNVFLMHQKHEITDIIKVASFKSFKLFDINNKIFNNNIRFRKVYILTEVQVRQKNFPSLGVVVDIFSEMNLTKILKDIRNSIWWNSQAYFLLINRNPHEDCEALKYLKILWDFKILSAVYICSETRNVLYTFNPFANLAPIYWRQVEVNHENWTLLKLRLHQGLIGPNLCKTLFFDKGHRLNGYRLKAEILEDEIEYYDGKKSEYLDKCVGWAPKVLCNVLACINASIDVKKSSVIAKIDKNGNPLGPLNDIHHGKVDIIMRSYFLRSYWKQMTYPFYFHINYVLCLASPISFKGKLSFLFEWKFWIVLILACTSCIFIIKNILRESKSLAFIKFLQMVLSNSHIREPPRFHRRILLYIVIMVTTAVNSFMQLHLNWWSALPKHEATLQSIADVANANLTFYGFDSNKDLILQHEYIKKFKGIISVRTCLNMLNNGEQVACIIPTVLLGKIFWQKNPLIYKLKDCLFERGVSFIYTEDFPLRYKLDVVLQRMREGGLLQLIYSKCLSMKNCHSQHLKIRKPGVEFDTVNLEKLIFCVYVLLFGWTFAAIALAAELLIWKFNFTQD